MHSCRRGDRVYGFVKRVARMNARSWNLAAPALGFVMKGEQGWRKRQARMEGILYSSRKQHGTHKSRDALTAQAKGAAQDSLNCLDSWILVMTPAQQFRQR